MLLCLIDYLQSLYHPFAVFHYLTMRSLAASLSALLMALFLGPSFIRYLTQYKIKQIIRSNGPASHASKAGTPTMGGALILVAVTLSTLLWADLSQRAIWVVLLVTLGFGLIGMWDDYQKLVLQHAKGFSARGKYLSQSLIGAMAALFIYYHAKGFETALLIPYVKHVFIPLGLLSPILTYFVIVGSSNAVNLTDGLDGLAIMPAVLIAGALGLFAYVTGHVKFAAYLDLPYIMGAGELCIFCSALLGAGLGFLWFNAYPAQIFMGDVGSLAIGAALGTVAVLVRQEIVLFIMSGVFVMETLSVIVQVGSYKLRGKRIFLMAPIHHHFELKGWPEPKVIVRFWILTVIFVICGLASLKIR